MCVSAQLKYVQLYTIVLYQSRQFLVTLQYPLETVLIETYERLGGFILWLEEVELHMPACQSSAECEMVR